MKLYTDGAARGNPGEAGGGIHLIDGGKTYEKAVYFGTKTNNQSEYMALIEGLKFALDKGAQDLEIFMDSELVVRQIQGKYKVKNANLKILLIQVQDLLKKLPKWNIKHIKRELNKRADFLSNIAIDDKNLIEKIKR